MLQLASQQISPESSPHGPASLGSERASNSISKQVTVSVHSGSSQIGVSKKQRALLNKLQRYESEVVKMAGLLIPWGLGGGGLEYCSAGPSRPFSITNSSVFRAA